MEPFNLALAVAFGVVGLCLGGRLAGYASRRSAAMPLALEDEAEAEVLALVLARPECLAKVAILTSGEFAVPAHAALWSTIATAVEIDPELGEAGGALRDRVRALLCAAGEAGPVAVLDGVADHPVLAALVGEAGGEECDIDEAGLERALLGAGAKVLSAGDDRNRLSGSAPVAAGPEAGPTLVRVVAAASSARRRWSGVVLGAGLAAASLLAATVAPVGSGAFFAALAALEVLVVVCLVVSLVDLDTFYIDVAVFWPATAAAWALAAVAAVYGGEPRRVLAGVAVVVGIAAVFEGANLVYRLLRGGDGMGFGDTMIVVATAGVPAALSGSWQLGLYGVWAGMVVGIVGWVVGAARGRLHRDTPFAFGPYLACGWILAWAVLVGLGR